MDKVRRVLVHVCTERSSPQRALFVQSVTGHFSEGGADEVEVSCSLQRRRLVLSRGDGGRGSPLKRPAFCPIKHLSIAEAAAIPLDVQQRGVDVGVAIILQTANQRVLLTRRAKELRIFPNVWVPPGCRRRCIFNCPLALFSLGGHLEPDETLLEAGLRELWEETGLKLEPEGASPKILGLWESVYPAMLSRGPPERHHIVVYMLLLSSRSHLQLQTAGQSHRVLWGRGGCSSPERPAGRRQRDPGLPWRRSE
ncbi:nucleoside diphosphate-linked moiety X motif 17 isoform X3 [Pseudoliparis swirei]|uniref:nucleoside diphosphate-linked moiety X motif 17 isoform X3 n=1 Tax=Pseudoliparis swirei TaxID=2059687 RepID=UPI0024BDB5B0|nr:nucleoside diphosphate-linked moiety X motif 17 isoform X3 [Pseudoliparis swirei]